ncbi:MAG: polysaccharide deacetylase family protein [Bacteroidales bacterium]|jgi:peptidoglycan/xylan/chitin deacetylase (PgdA/CDA1 family)|nr:polysaccharide deacetylase family protein [Bacteroidales bacterium]
MKQFGKPFPARFIFPDALFRMAVSEKRLFLTFDDGPDPESTPVILDILKARNVKATFFCTGHKVLKHPGIFARIAAEGHSIGNHGYSHLNGLTTSVRTYCSDIMKGREITCSTMFRPPYGRIRRRQYKILERTMRIVFWDVMPYDFDKKLDPETSLSILRRRLHPGSIIVLHDSAGSHATLFLDRFLSISIAEGYHFGSLNDNSLRG